MKYHTIITDDNNKLILEEWREIMVHASPDNDDDLKGHWTVTFKGSVWRLLQAFGPQIMGLFSKFGGQK